MRISKAIKKFETVLSKCNPDTYLSAFKILMIKRLCKRAEEDNKNSTVSNVDNFIK